MPTRFSGFFKQELQETLETTIVELVKKISTVKPKHLIKYVEAIENLISFLPKEEIIFTVNEKVSEKEEPTKSSISIEDNFSETLKALKNMASDLEKITENEK